MVSRLSASHCVLTTTCMRCSFPAERYTLDGGIMPHRENDPSELRPRTAVLTRGFDPSLSFGSARPAVFRSSTYVFRQSGSGRARLRRHHRGKSPVAGKRADLIYSRFSHPNAEILEDQIVPLEAGRGGCRGFQLRHGGDHDGVLHLRPPGQRIVYTTPLYGGTTGLIHSFLEPFGVRGIRGAGGRFAGAGRGHRSGGGLLHRVPGNARQSDAHHDRYRARRRGRSAPSGATRW